MSLLNILLFIPVFVSGSIFQKNNVTWDNYFNTSLYFGGISSSQLLFLNPFSCGKQILGNDGAKDSKLTRPLQGFVQFEYFDGSACNGTKTFITGVQTDYCTLHASRNGSYKIQIHDGES
jgi:hypothetical protein